MLILVSPVKGIQTSALKKKGLRRASRPAHHDREIQTSALKKKGLRQIDMDVHDHRLFKRLP